MRRAVIAILAAALTSAASVASAATVAPTESKLIFGDDANHLGKARFAKWVGKLDLYEEGFTVYKIARLYKLSSSGDFAVDYGETKRRSGSWTWGGEDGISFVAYHAKNYFAAQYFEPGIYGNSFDAEDLGLVNAMGKGRKIKHITLFGIDGVLKEQTASASSVEVEPEPVPLPAGALLLISGLGLMALRRRA